ncbi:hypothetical protein PFISCL1PPCAC_17834, partial [Pristionchus fissidentatus]
VFSSVFARFSRMLTLDDRGPPRLLRAAGVRASIRTGPSPPILEHAKIVLEYFASLKADDSQTDVEVKSGGRLVCMAHRLVLAAFSIHFKSALFGVQDSPMATLDIDPAITGIPWILLEEVIDFCYTGQCRYSEKLLAAARAFRCPTLISTLERAQDSTSSSPPRAFVQHQLIVDEVHAANLLEALYQFKIDGAFIDCLFSQKDHRAESVRLHRLVLCAYARHFENTLRDAASGVQQVSLVIDHSQLRATSLDLRCVVDFFYMGYVRAAKKRLRSIRSTASYLGVQRLVAEIDLLMSNIGSEEEVGGGDCSSNSSGVQQMQPTQQQQHAQFEEVLEMEYGGDVGGDRPGSSSLVYKQAEGMDEEFIGGDDDVDGMMQSPYMGDYDYSQDGTPPSHSQQQQHLADTVDMVGSSVEEYSNIYEQYVEGPRRGKRGGTYHKRPEQVKVKGPTAIVRENDRDADEMPAVTMTCAPPSNRRRRGDMDSYGYGLPEIFVPSEVTVPLVVGDQQIMMERPYKCPYCNHRTREKSAVEKHVRCMHTLEAPYKCRYCSQTFKVQSNLVRHIRAHTGEKPYQCRKCGVAYADKKNMDAHVYREHLKMRQFECDYPNCAAKFWRNDRFYLHYAKVHGPLPSRDQEPANRERWSDDQ